MRISISTEEKNRIDYPKTKFSSEIKCLTQIEIILNIEILTEKMLSELKKFPRLKPMDRKSVIN